MLACIKNSAPRQVGEANVRDGPRRAAAAMPRPPVMHIKAIEPQLPSANRQVHILHVDKEALVEPAEPLEVCSPHHHEGADHLIDNARFVVGPLGHEVRPHKSWRNPVEPQRLPNDASGRGETGARPLDLSLCIDELNPDDAGSRPRSVAEPVTETAQGSGLELDIGIEEQEQPARPRAAP